jgi:hypothetical protein
MAGRANIKNNFLDNLMIEISIEKIFNSFKFEVKIYLLASKFFKIY